MSEPTSTFENDLGEVQACDCGGVSLTLGSVSIHFSADETAALGELVDAALKMGKAAQKAARPKAQGSWH